MRTTLNLDDDVLQAARLVAQQDGRSLGAVVSELARRGLRPRRPRAPVGRRIPTFSVSPDARPVGPEDARALEEW
jgi:plasmid stability protein